MRVNHHQSKKHLRKKATVVFEAQFANNPDLNTIERTLAKGYKVKMNVVHIKPESALNNVYHRTEHYGRDASIKAMSSIQGNLSDGLKKYATHSCKSN